MNFFEFSTMSAEILYEGSVSLPPKDPEGFSVSRYLADILCNPLDKQHVVLNIVSKSGKGKSVVANAIAYALSVELASRLGRTPDYYFNPSHVVILNKKYSRSLMLKLTQLDHPIMIIDEGSDENNSRRSMTNDNVIDMKLYAVIRETGMCIIRCVQFKTFMDKAVRDQATHEIFIISPHHDLGYNDCKFKILVDHDGSKEPWGLFPVSKDGYTKYKRVRIGLPPEHILSPYNEAKSEATSAFISSALSEVNKETEAENRKSGGRRARQDVEAWCKAAWQYHLDDPTLSKSKCVRMVKGCRETFDKWLEANGKESWTPTKGNAVDDV